MKHYLRLNFAAALVLGISLATAAGLVALLALARDADSNRIMDWAANGLIAYIGVVLAFVATVGAEHLRDKRTGRVEAEAAKARLDLLLDRVHDEILLIVRRATELRESVASGTDAGRTARTVLPNAMWLRLQHHLDEIEDATLVYDLDEFHGRVTMLHKAESERVRHLLDHPGSDRADQGVKAATGAVLCAAPLALTHLRAAQGKPCGDIKPSDWLPHPAAAAAARPPLRRPSNGLRRLRDIESALRERVG